MAGTGTPEHIVTAVPLPPESEEHVNLRKVMQPKEKPGFLLSLIDISYKKEIKFGLTIRNFDHHVIISKLMPNSLCAEKLLVGDHVYSVNTMPVTDREATKALIMKSFVKKKQVTLIVYRPVSSEAKLWAKTAITSSSTRTSSTAPREKTKWAQMAAQQRAIAKSLARQDHLKEHQAPSARGTVNSSTNVSARQDLP